MPEPNRPRTIMESDDEIRAALQQAASAPEIIVRGPRPPQRPPQRPTPEAEEVIELEPVSEIARPPKPGSTAKPFRPSLRSAVPLLIVCDDGSQNGEVFRLRGERFVIGRNSGDLQLPHDALVSGKHLEIVRVTADGRHRWLIADLKSTHGTFFRFSSHRLTDRMEFLCGRTRFRFEEPAADAAPPQTDRTMGWDAVAAASAPKVTELGRGAPGRSAPLDGGECWIGTDGACALRVKDDPFLEAKHAKVYQHAQRGWLVENAETANGVWVRKDQHVFDPANPQGSSIRFQIGEQQFKLTVAP